MAIIKGSQISGSVAGAESASYALTASYALNSSGTGFPFSGSAVITGSLVVSGSGITGSLSGTASFATTASYIDSLGSSNYSQSFSNSNTWTVTHNLGTRFVLIQVYDSGYDEMIPQNIDLTDDNTATITFPTLESGYVIASVGGALSSGNTYITNTGGSTGSFAITGSNAFVGDQVITGSLFVSGGLSVGANNLLIDADAAFPFVVGYGPNAVNNKNNTALGYFTLMYNSSGNGNVALGGGALTNNTTGNDNTAVGSSALVSNETGFSNVAIGWGAQAQASSPALNVAIGYQALFLGGANNVAVGYQAGRYATSTSQRNVYIGYASGPTASLDESDKLYIANAAGTPLIGGDFDTKVVTINGSQVVSGSVTSSNVLTNSIIFNTDADIIVGQGELAWNGNDGTLDLGLKYGDVVLQVGQEQHYIVRNATGDVISNGTAVYASGVTGGSGRVEASPFTANGAVREVRFLGLATHNISNGVNGVVTNFGYVRGLDTRGTATTAISVGDEDWSQGDILYAHPTAAGKLTNIPPKHKIYVAIVITRHQNTGVLFVRPSSYGHIDDIHDVGINTGSLSTGDLLIYNSGSDEWQNSRALSGSYQLTGSLTATSITGSIAATNGLISGSAQLASSFPSKTVGTWTVPAGASVRSFTVDLNHSYQMWVIGNIPNGIISWNATVNVTNANVPIVGSQYGWYYAAGNALVLTAIPNQIVGVNGSISTATVTTTTSNTFEFGITNNSGTTQTITYGYVKLS